MNVQMIGPLDRGEIFWVLEHGTHCRLAAAENNRPYVVPVNYRWTFEEGRLVFFIDSKKIGEKMRCMRMNRKVALEFEVADQDAIYTVLAAGQVTDFLHAQENAPADGQETVEVFAESISGRKYLPQSGGQTV